MVASLMKMLVFIAFSLLNIFKIISRAKNINKL